MTDPRIIPAAARPSSTETRALWAQLTRRAFRNAGQIGACVLGILLVVNYLGDRSSSHDWTVMTIMTVVTDPDFWFTGLFAAILAFALSMSSGAAHIALRRLGGEPQTTSRRGVLIAVLSALLLAAVLVVLLR